ncbi:MAG: Xaa-Pro aminopeptidase [Ignavibacteria bacterium RBG_13_36_8]|nr:MAG: Xaa-Pro aminopeptidase [Ignavibacteria bacterium RBG_13_36_8]
MFEAKIYIERRRKLKELVKTGLIFLPGNSDVPMNYKDNTYRFRQDSSFLYYFGLDEQNLAAIIDADSGKEILFGDDLTMADIIWTGPRISMATKGKLVGVSITKPMKELAKVISRAKKKRQKIHYLPQYRAENKIWFEDVMGIKAIRVNSKASEKLIRAVISQREIKSPVETEQIEAAINVSYDMYVAAMKMVKPGMNEKEVWAILEGMSLKDGSGTSFPMILSIHPETLHNHYHGNVMKDGNILVLDSGVESPMYYASDITRTFPVNGKYSDLQKALYEIVLKANLTAIGMMKPGIPFRDCHFAACKIIVTGMKELGYMRGNIDDALKAGAHALFMPHGLGHMLGLDVHDMENLGENYVGYDDEFKRSKQFGTAYLRMAKRLHEGHVMTVEPGIYFIPELIEQWKADKKYADFIDFEKVSKDVGIGGFRVEDDILVTETGSRVLGKPIPKTVKEVEEACNR